MTFRRPISGAILCLTAAVGLSCPAMAKFTLKESPFMERLVRLGKLPPVDRRVPRTPSIVPFDGSKDRQTGVHGGVLRMLVGRTKDIRLMVVYGYARLVAYDRDLSIKPDILERYEVEEGRRFTFHLRKGHKWSDGHPFTTDAFRYYWKDVANHPKLAPLGPPRQLVVDGEKARFEVIDDTTVRYSWSKPNPDFLPALAGATPLYIYRPAHYLKRYHARYADPAKLTKLVKKSRRRNWAALHNRRDNQYKNDNPKLPTLQPWINRTKPPSQRFEFTANPYYHRVDPEGRQLPYIPKVMMTVADPKIIPLKTAAGESDLQARGISFGNYTVLKGAEKRHDQKVLLWRTAKGSHIALFPNLNVRDPAWRKLFRERRFRRALSMATDRHEINQVIYFGLAIEGNNTVLPQSPLYKPDYRQRWAKLDIKRANKILDGLGLTKRSSRGIRLLPDGRPMEIVVETAGESSEQSDVLELVHDSWKSAGIKLFTRPSQREVLRNRIFAGETMVSVWSGHENGIPTADTAPDEFAPTSQQQLQWPKWGQYYQTNGQAGEPIDIEAARRLMELRNAWVFAPSIEEKEKLWRQMLELYTDNVFSIGLISGVLQPVVTSNRLRNVPEKGIYNWSPGAHFGIYRPDTFWFKNGAAQPRAVATTSGQATGRKD